MFASLKRSPAATPSNSSVSTEKHSGADYADLEKRADGRWSVQIRPGTLEAAVDAVRIDGKAPRRQTCCGFIPAYVGVLLFIMLALMISVVFMGVTGANIAQNGASMRHVDFLVAATSLPLWAFLSAICLLGLYATWRDRLKLFTLFWFAFVCHWVLDFASTIVFLVVAYQRDVTQPSDEVCLERGLERGCVVPVNLMLVFVTVGLCLFKIIGAYALYVMYKYRLTLLSSSQRSTSPTVTKSSPKSPSTPARLSPFSPFKPKSRAFPKSPRQGRPWPPTNIPTIKIDLASDQSSASSYSNGLSGTGSAGFAVFEFAAKYPSLRTAPLDPIGENLKAALERERKKDEERVREEADLGLVKVRNARGREEMVEVPTLAKYSVVGSNHRY